MPSVLKRLEEWLYQHRLHLLIVALFLVINIAVRLSFIDFISGDFTTFLSHWLNFIHSKGLSAYGVGFSNYSPFYTYMLGIGDWLFPDMPSLYLIKYITFIGEALAGYWVYKLVAMHYVDRPQSVMPILAAMLCITCPSVIANGTIAGQCDIWYLAFLFAGLHHLLHGRPYACMVYAGLAYSFKLQAIFLSPLLLLFILRKKIPWWTLAIVPAVYILTCLPAWAEGRPWEQLLNVYWSKFAREGINSNAANFYTYLKDFNSSYVTRLGLLVSVEIAALLVYIHYKYGKSENTVFSTVLLATLFGGVMPFVLPTMHDRYFFIADMFSLILVCLRPRWWILPVLFQSATLIATPPQQVPRLHGLIGWLQHQGLETGAWVNLLAISLTLYWCWRELWRTWYVAAPKAALTIPDIAPYVPTANTLSDRPLLSVVVPCYNEEANLLPFYERLRKTLAYFAAGHAQIIFVDDGSRDHTWGIIERLRASDSDVRGIRLSRNFGHQMALTCGLEHAMGERVLVIDADLQDPPELLAEMLRKMDDGAEVVVGKRLHRTGETLFKTLSAWGFYRCLSKLSEVDIPLDTGDFRLMKREVVQALRDLPERVRYTRGLISWLGFSQSVVEYVRHPRHAGESQYTLPKMLQLAGDGITSFSTRPLQLATWVGIGMMGVSTILLGYVFISWLFFRTVPGWTSLAAIFLFSQAFQWLVLGIIGNYIAVIFRESKHRPLYIVRETTHD